MGPVVIFDSGVGGLSIYQEIKRVCPDQNYVFVSDNQAFPYGTKDENALVKRVVHVVGHINDVYAPSVLVVACNTASTVVLPLLREKFAFIIVGVVPAIKPAAQLSKRKQIGLLATPATVARAYTDQLIDEFASDCVVHRVGSSELVEIAERRLHGVPVSPALIEPILAPFLDIEEIDVLVLACTHFPLINKEIEAVFKSKNRAVRLVDSGLGIARRVSQLAIPVKGITGINTAVFTSPLNSTQLQRELNLRGFSEIQHLSV